MRKQARTKIAEFKKPSGLDKGKNTDEWEDIDEHERDVFDKDGYYNVMESEAMISQSDQKILDQFKSASAKPAKVSEGRSLADLILQKLNAGDFQDGDEMDMEDKEKRGGDGFGVE